MWEVSAALRQTNSFFCRQKQVEKASDPSSSEAVDRDASVWLIHSQDPEQRPEIDLLHAMAGLMLPGQQRSLCLLAKLNAFLLLTIQEQWSDWSGIKYMDSNSIKWLACFGPSSGNKSETKMDRTNRLPCWFLLISVELHPRRLGNH